MNVIQKLKCWPFCTKDIVNFNWFVDYRIETESFEVSLPINKHSPQTLAFNDISVSIDGRNILQNVHGLAEPGKITAILGPSGSGNTTTLDRLFGLQRVDSGVITLNGERLNKDLRRKMAYVQQRDIFLPYITLDETFQYHAELKLPSHFTKEKRNYLDSLSLFYKMNDPKLLNSRMGDVLNRGLSGGEMKRANIICESMGKAPVMLLDETTTGLDSYNALNVIKMISQFAVRCQKTIIMTVHQPSKKLLSYFDNILVMSAGEVAYFGKRDDLSDTLSKVNPIMETGYNPADFIMEQLYTEYRSKLIELARKRHEESSTAENSVILLGNGNSTIPTLDMAVAVNPQNQITNILFINEGTATESGQPSDRSTMFPTTSKYLTAGNEDDLDFDKWPTSYWQQLKILFRRNLINSAKMTFTILNSVYTFLLICVVSALWFQMEMREENLLAITGNFFFCSFFWSMHCTFEAFNATPDEIAVTNKEPASGMYRLSAYCLDKIISKIAICMLRPMVFHVITYSCFGVQSAAAFFCQLGMILICAILSQVLGMFVGSLRLDMRKGVIVCSLICIPSILFANFFVPSIPSWIWFLQFLSPVYYNFKAMLAIHFTYGVPVRCALEHSMFPECVSGNATFISAESLLQGDGTIWLWIVIPLLSILLICVLIYLSYRFIKRPARTTARRHCFCC